MDNDDFILDTTNSLDITSRFSPNPTTNNPQEEKFNLFKSQFEPLVKLAEKKYLHDSLGTMFEKKQTGRYNKSENAQASNSDKKINKNIRTQSLDLERIKNYSKGNFKGKEKNFSEKINTEKNEFENSIFNEYDSFSEKQNNTVSNMLKREKYFAAKKNLKLNKIKDSLLFEEQLNVKYTPGIDAGSMKIINKKLKDKKPIYERYLDIQKEKKEKIESYKKNLMRTNSVKIINSKDYNNLENSNPNYNINFKNKTEDYNLNVFIETHINSIEYTEHFRDWLISNEKWSFKKEIKFEKLKKKLVEEQLDYENSTFTPNIDKISDYIANLKSFNEFPGIEVYDKLYLYKDLHKNKQRNLIEKETPSFTPLINKSFPKYLLEYKKNQKLNHRSNLYEKGKAEIELILKQRFGKKLEQKIVSAKIKKEINDSNNNKSNNNTESDPAKTKDRSGLFYAKDDKKKEILGNAI